MKPFQAYLASLSYADGTVWSHYRWPWRTSQYADKHHHWLWTIMGGSFGRRNIGAESATLWEEVTRVPQLIKFMDA